MLQYKYAVFFCVFFPFLLNQVKEVVLQVVAHNCPTGSFFVESIRVFIFVFVLQHVAQCVFSQYTICNTKFLYYKLKKKRVLEGLLFNTLWYIYIQIFYRKSFQKRMKYLQLNRNLLIFRLLILT